MIRRPPRSPLFPYPTLFRSISRVWCGRMPSSPSMPGTVTMSTSSEYVRRSGLTISSWSGIGLPHAFRIGEHVLDRAGHEEGLLRQCVVLALEDLAEAAHRLLALDVLAAAPGERLGHEHRLAHEALQATRPGDGDLVLLGQLVHPQDGDDVLEVAVALQRALDFAGDLEVVVADDPRIENRRGA